MMKPKSRNEEEKKDRYPKFKAGEKSHLSGFRNLCRACDVGQRERGAKEEDFCRFLGQKTETST